MKIILVTDAWAPQVNGVVRNYTSLINVLTHRGHTVQIISPLEFQTLPCPTYPEIRLSLWPQRKIDRLLEQAQPDAVHIATEGPLGWAARHFCRKHKWPFSTCYHSKFPEYIHQRARIPLGLTYRMLQRFHGAASKTMVTNEDLQKELTQRDFQHLVRRRVGVDLKLFKPNFRPQSGVDKSFLDQTLKLPRPIFVCHGRVASEKNLSNFINMKLPGSKLVIGPGPLLEKYQKTYPFEKTATHFTGYLPDEDLVRHIASADAFVFPSVTETFGFVQLEALACGIPVAALPVTGPKAVLGESSAGVMNHDLQQAALDALNINPQHCLERAKKFSWEDGADDFLEHLAPIEPLSC